jgi:S-adenosylmethionine-diacylgycerolhomoserine-N-methlytransferase
MDRMYRWTRHVYDLTRRYYLLGRDRLIADIAKRPPAAVLEVGCGTARNLRELAAAAPQHELYGIDASHQMLATARRSLDAAGASHRVTLAHGLAQSLRPEHLGRTAPFDVVFCSYVLSMIPDHDDALDACLDVLPPGGRLFIVDFWDQANLPGPFARMLQGWLALFDVAHRPALLRTLRRLDRSGAVDLDLDSIAGRYAYLARIRKR